MFSTKGAYLAHYGHIIYLMVDFGDDAIISGRDLTQISLRRK